MTAAIGEPLDNSIEGPRPTTLMRVRTVFGPRQEDDRTESLLPTTASGIEPTKMHHVLSMGYSSPLRRAKGGWGVSASGFKLAGLSIG
ncbi:hypothetical protein [Streptomyces sp. CBG30]|uniref:hypothetical protein n=1 Tax=Streptomyces sp. CBG30 TaxID=2838869 RepID=UPI00203712DF|nr:hypothetical protein [Streptomyces sp. CBG30]